jgi:hypothetical protein
MQSSLAITPAGENIVANIGLYNPVEETTKIMAQLDIPLEKPILNRCKDYKLTVLRFQCMLTSVKPLFSVDGKIFRLTIRTPTSSDTQVAVGSPAIQTIHEFVNMTNTMLSNAHNNILPGTDRPYIYYQPENKLFYLVYPAIYQSMNVEILFNQTLYTYLSGFPAERLPNYANNRDWYRLKLKAVPDDGYNYISPRYSLPGFRLVEEYPTDFRFNSLQSVIVTSNIPIRHEYLPQTTNNMINSLLNPFSFISMFPVLTDFRPALEHYGQQNSSIIYFPQGEFRWIDMMSDNPLDRLSFNFLFQTSDQKIHQIYLEPGESVSLKPYFKSVY